MDFDRPHRTITSTSSSSELLICFASRLSSSSSMKMISSSSKSILSPGRTARDMSLSTSLSRRVKTSRSIKYGPASSPFFPAGGKRRGGSSSGFENPEPSSPKVTCIGQVRVKKKKKKQGKEMMVMKQSTSDNEPCDSRHECLTNRWVHLPLTICEALRAFGNDFNCFLPCYSSSSTCVSSKSERLEKEEEQEEREGGGRGGRSVVQRRSRFLDEILRIEEDEPRNDDTVTASVPPKNALLLMRCRSDPVKMEALANRLSESPAPRAEDIDKDEDDEEEDEDEDEEAKNRVAIVAEEEEQEQDEDDEEEDNPERSKESDSLQDEDLAEEVVMLRILLDFENEEDEASEPKYPGSETSEVGPNRRSGLPDCLLLMMYEPKLSMEVSKETWVRHTDFSQWIPARREKTNTMMEVIETDGGGEINKRYSVDRAPLRTSYSSMAALIEEKLVSAKAYEPFVLTRCKSEPKKVLPQLAPDACFWKNRQLERHHAPAGLGVGTAGLGF